MYDMLHGSASQSYPCLINAVAAFVAAIGLVVIVGWLLRIDLLMSVAPGLATMKFNTALCFFLSGISLYLSDVNRPSAQRRIGFGCAATVLIISILTLAQYVGSWNIGIDELIVADSATPAESWPGRMSIATAINFTLMALALLLLDHNHKWGFFPVFSLALVGILIGGAALLGYLYGVRTIRFNIFSTMAVHTALTFVVLGIGVVAVRPWTGLVEIITDHQAAGRLLRVILPAVITIPIVIGGLTIVGFHRGIYGLEFAFAVFTLASIIVLAVVVWKTARMLYRMQIKINAANREQAFLAAIIATSDDAIISKDLNGTIISWNDGAERIYGYSAREARGRSMSLVIPPDKEEEERNILALIGAGKRVEHIETTRRHKDGRLIDMSIAVSPIVDANGEVIGASNIGRDISARKQTEAQLQMTNQELMRSNKDLEQFAYIASHDLQEPLRAVSGCVQLLGSHLAEHMDDKADEYMGHVVDGATRMQALIEDLLMYSRAGRIDAEFQSIDTNKVVTTALQNLSRAIEESAAVIDCDSLPPVNAISAQLALVFQNVIANAIKFRHKQRPLRISISSSLEGDNTCVFAIKDNGIGIEPQFFERIFVIFQRLHTRQEYSGTGLGLALCKRIIEHHGGKIWVDSTAGVGTTIFFALSIGTTVVENELLMESS